MVVNIALIVVVVHITVFGCITVTKNLIIYNSPVDYQYLADYASLVTQKVAVETMIVLVAREVNV